MAFYENETLEYKRQYTPDIKKEVVAFANTAGGTIYIGVDDNGTPVGVQDPDAVVQQLTNALRDGIRPDVTMFTRIAIQDVGGCPVVAVTVSTGTRRPCTPPWGWCTPGYGCPGRPSGPPPPRAGS